MFSFCAFALSTKITLSFVSIIINELVFSLKDYKVSKRNA